MPRNKPLAKKSSLLKGKGGLAPCEMKRRKSRPGTTVKKEIKKYQNSTELLIKRATFRRLVKEIVGQNTTGILIQANAIQALQEAAEAHLVELFQQANIYAQHAQRMTVMQKDFELAKKKE
jgi:histone H3/H4